MLDVLGYLAEKGGTLGRDPGAVAAVAVVAAAVVAAKCKVLIYLRDAPFIFTFNRNPRRNPLSFPRMGNSVARINRRDLEGPTESSRFLRPHESKCVNPV